MHGDGALTYEDDNIMPRGLLRLSSMTCDTCLQDTQ